MKKLFITTITMQPNSTPVYSTTEDATIKYNEPIYFPISAVLAENINADDNIKICSIKIKDSDNAESENIFNDNYNKLQNEINKIVALSGAKVTYTLIESNFIETKDVFGHQFMQLFDILENKEKIYADITFGAKPFVLIIMNILSFAEKFYNADIEKISYGKASYIKDANGKSRIDPNTTRVCDISALYYLNNITANMDADSGEEAKDLLSRFFGL
ncbi:MAG: hypothetical protein IKQ61_05195 [Spirochaetales bacterium]|nr:hypothetical protein [Spirochaetales bacterium]